MLFNRILGSRKSRRAVKREPQSAGWNTTKLRLELLDERVVPAFADPISFATGSNPGTVASADFNDDGLADLAVANASGNNVSVLLANGNGTFQPALHHDTFSWPRALSVADFNGDGRRDLAVASGIMVDLLLGNGDGTFAAAPLIAPYTFPVALAAGDLNGDSQVDLVVTSVGSVNVEEDIGFVEVFMNNGDGTFASSSRTEIAPYPFSVALADFDRDGNLDVVTTESYYVPYAVVFLGNGDGTLANPAFYPIGGGTYFTLAVADLNGDSNPDVVARGGGGLNYLIGNGDGTFEELRGYFAGYGGYLEPLAVADFNRDGHADIATTTQVFLGNGGGTLNPPIPYRLGISLLPSLAAGDFNGDGWPDLAVADPSATSDPDPGSGSVLLNDGNWSGASTPSIQIGDAVVIEGNTGTSAISFTVALSAASTQAVSVGYATTNGTATVGSDYQAASGTLSFAPGETSKTVIVLVNGDLVYEPDETFFVDLNNAANATIADGQALGTIVNDDAAPSVSISVSDVTKPEGKKGEKTIFTFTVTLSAASNKSVTMSYSTADGTAKISDKDYASKNGTLTFKPGETAKTIAIEVTGDSMKEADETFFVNLSNAKNATIADGQALGTIVNDDAVPIATRSISISDAAKKEGKKNQTTQFIFAVTLSAAYDQPVVMSFKTVNGTATTSDADYAAKTGTLTFKPGETTKTITIEVKGDSKKEADEYFYLDLFGNSSNSLFTKNRGTGTISNDD